MKWNKEQFRKLLLILLGNFIYTAGVVYFVLPAGLIVGGTTGISLCMNHYFGIPIDLFVSVFNIAMFVVGAVILGKAFAMTTLLSSIAFPVFLRILQTAAGYTGYPTTEPMLCTVFAGVMIGCGIALVIQQGASTGGMDIPPLALNRLTGISVAVLMYVCDTVILIFQVFFTKSEMVLYGILLVCIYTVMLNKVLVTGKACIQLMIISREYRAINEMILHRYDRGTTLFEVEGGYTGAQTLAVMTIISQRELFALNTAVKQIDPEAFIVINQVKEVSGYGFTLRKRP